MTDIAPFIISETATLLEAMRAIDDNWHEFVLAVDAEGRAVGTVTDGDIRRGLLTTGRFDLRVASVMHRGFVFVTPEVPRNNVLDLMQARDIRQVPILDAARRPVGFHFLRNLLGNGLKPNNAVIMAGGKGTRLRPLTEKCPKPMLPVAGKPILEHLVLHLVGQGIRTIWVSVNYLGEMIMDHFGDGGDFGCDMRYLHEVKELGTAGSLSLLPAPPEHPLLVLNGDLITQVNADALLRFHDSMGNPATVCARPHHYEVPFGVLDTEDGRLLAMREKPRCHFLVNAGIYVVDGALLGLIPPGEPFTMPALLDAAKDAGHGVSVYDMHEEWLDVGRPSELDKARGLA